MRSSSDRAVPSLSPGLGHCVVFLDKTLYSHSAHLQVYTQVYTWPGSGEFNAGRVKLCDGLACHPGRGEGEGNRNPPSRFMLQKAELSIILIVANDPNSHPRLVCRLNLLSI